MDGEKESLFKVGDVVELKSGGPEMTVFSIDDALVYAAWYDEGQYHTETFYAATLRKIEA